MATIPELSGTYSEQGVIQETVVTSHNYDASPPDRSVRRLSFDFTNGQGDHVHATFEVTSADGVETSNIFPPTGQVTVTVDVS